MLSRATYIWIDGAQPTQTLRSKTRFLELKKQPKVSDLPLWGFDGSSTNQAIGDDSDLTLQPVALYPDPLNDVDQDILVLCEVILPNDHPHPTNHRAALRQIMSQCKSEDPWIGFEQEYTLFSGSTPLGWPDRGYPAPQGPFYCGVGADEAFGRQLVEEHTNACIAAKLMLFGTNAEVMPGQWEFQIGYRGFSNEVADPITVADHLWIARWLLYRIGEDYGISATLHPKPVKGDWNGAGMHTNISTRAMRDKKAGMQAIEAANQALARNHEQHIDVYGAMLEERLTGKHETASIESFSTGISHRGASVRIPRSVARQGYGYLEDRRPGANANPYEVAIALLRTICGIVS